MKKELLIEVSKRHFECSLHIRDKNLKIIFLYVPNESSNSLENSSSLTALSERIYRLVMFLYWTQRRLGRIFTKSARTNGILAKKHDRIRLKKENKETENVELEGERSRFLNIRQFESFKVFSPFFHFPSSVFHVF